VLKGSVNGERAAYFSYAFNELTQAGSTISSYPKVKYVSTLNKTSSLVYLGDDPVLIIDDYLAQTLEDMSRLFLGAPSTAECGALALRLLAEKFHICNQPEWATYAAVNHSILMNSREAVPNSETEAHDLERIDTIQQVFLLAHEVAHILWLEGRQPSDFEERVACLATLDAGAIVDYGMDSFSFQTARIADLHQLVGGTGNRAMMNACAAAVRETCYSPQKVREATLRRGGSESSFVEEVWADFYGWTACMRLFLGSCRPETVHSAVCLALRNLVTIDSIERIGEGSAGRETMDDLSARRRLLRMLLTNFIGDVRANPEFQENSGLSERDLAVDITAIANDVDNRYYQGVWKPMMTQVFRLLFAELPSDVVLAARHAFLQKEFGPDPALRILQENSIDSNYYDRVLASA
jgi:hypothetical protein